MSFVKQVRYILQQSFILLLCLLTNALFSQDVDLDTLKLALKNEKNDTTRLSLMIDIGTESSLDDEMKYCQEAVVLADKLLKDIRYGSQQAQKSILSKKATAIHEIGYVFERKGDIQASLHYTEMALKINESIGNKNHAAEDLNSIAYMYFVQHDHKKAIEIYLKNLDFYIHTNNEPKMADMYNYLGVMNRELGNLNEAFKYWGLSIKILERVNNKTDLGLIHYNMAKAYMDRKDNAAALEHFFKSLDMYQQINDKDGIAVAYSGISKAYSEQKKYKQALMYTDSALTLSREIALPSNLKATEKVAYVVYAATGDYKKAFEHYKEYIKYSDSLNNEKTRKASIKTQLKFEFEKKEAVMKEQQERERVVAAEKDRFQKIVIGAVVIGLLLVAVFAFFILQSLKTTRHQKHIIEEKQKEILDSIHYAKRIQRSLLPTEKYVNKFLNRNN